MAAEGIFLIKDGKLQVLEEKPYDSEDLLQQALASFPEVLAGSSTAEATVRPLLLVRREMGVPKEQGASPTWSLDHLFVDAEGVPVVVEVKRSSDTRIRREVLGQMLDYAANAVRYWPLADLRAAFEDTAAQQRTTGDERLREIVPEIEPEDFWAAGRRQPQGRPYPHGLCGRPSASGTDPRYRVPQRADAPGRSARR